MSILTRNTSTPLSVTNPTQISNINPLSFRAELKTFQSYSKISKDISIVSLSGVEDQIL
ncbi:hypothetical protein [Chryseobacterium sp. FH1]|uniref:hypothetical protein n=1 Tax=Chryseobacterium sp. FH1 TaxID=1233951 RepID=UPI0013F44E28|nr:hypothetical protein [Chryseobacterium sp. FH1]